MSRSLLCLSLALAFGAVACGGGEPQPDAGHPADSGTQLDAGTQPDAGSDAGAEPDAGTDGGTLSDAGTDAGTAPTATIDLPDGGVMSSHDPLTVHFSQGMDRQTLQVGGTLAANGSNPIWSTTAEPDDTLQLEPAPQWPLGADLTLTVDAQNPSGAHASASATLTVSDPFAVQWTQLPDDPSTSGDATFAFACDLSGCTFRCALGDAALTTCTSPVSLTGLADGEHTMHVEATRGADTLLLTDTWTIDQTPPSLVTATFDGYGTLALTFDEPVDATAAAELARYTFTPAKPTGMSVTSASASGAVVSLGLSRYQLPVDYALTVSARDLAGNERTGMTADLVAAETGSRVAFVSQASGNGDLRNWAAVPGGSNPATGLEAADAICQAEATAAGLSGTFRAYLSDTHDDAACRMRNLSGKVSANCGLGAPPGASGGAWIGLDGLPVVRTLEELTLGNFLKPIAHHADGTAASTYQLAWHATETAAGKAGQARAATCTDWTAAGTEVVSTTVAYEKRIPLSLLATTSCSSSVLGLMCFQVEAGGFPVNSRYRKSGKVAFVTSATVAGDMASNGKHGLPGGDDLCRSLASAAGLANASSFTAWLSDETADAYCRVLGAEAKRSASPECGLASPPSTGPFVSTTGFELAADLTELVTTGPRVPIFATETGGFPAGVASWTGTTQSGVLKTSNGYACGGWLSAASNAGGERGQIPDALSWSDTGGWNYCNVPAPILCFER